MRAPIWLQGLALVATAALQGCALPHGGGPTSHQVAVTQSLAAPMKPHGGSPPAFNAASPMTQTTAVEFARLQIGSPKARGGTGNWRKESTKSKIDDETTCSLSINSQSQVKGWLGNGSGALLVLVTSRDVTLHLLSTVSLYSDRTARIGHYTPVRIRLDDRMGYEMNFYPDDNLGKSHFIERDMLSKLVEHRKLLIEVTAFNAGSSIIEFDLSGLAGALAWAAERCTGRAI